MHHTKGLAGADDRPVAGCGSRVPVSASISLMTGRGPLDPQPGHSLPVFDRIAPPPPPAIVAARIDLHTGPGDVVADLFGRGGWVARAAIDRQRLAVSLESSPLTRMLAEVVLRPPDVRHLDAAFQGLAGSPRRDSSLKVSISDQFATRCATCDRMLIADEIIWSVDDEAGIAGRARPVIAALSLHRLSRPARRIRTAPGAARRRRPAPGDGRRRCRGDARDAARPVSRDRRGGHAPRRAARPAHRRASSSVSGRSSNGSRAISGRRRSLAALRLAFVHAVLPASRLQRVRAGSPRCGLVGPRPAADRHAVPRTQALARVRGRVPARPRLHPAARGRPVGSRPGAARRGPAKPRRGERDHGRRARRRRRPRDPPRRSRRRTAERRRRPRVRLVLGQPPHRPNQDRLPWPTRRPPGRSVARRPRSCRSDAVGRRVRAPGGWQAEVLARALACARALARPRRAGRPARRRRRSRAWPSSLGGARPAIGCSARGSRRRRRSGRERRAAAPRRRLPPAARNRANVGSPPAAGRRRRSRRRARPRPLRAARAGRPPPVLRERRRPDRDRGRRRDPPGARRAGQLGAPARRDPHRPRPGRRAAPDDRATDSAPAAAGRGLPTAGDARRSPPRPDTAPATASRSRRASPDRDGRRRPGRPAARPDPRRARPPEPATAHRDRARPLVAGRPGRHRGTPPLPLADRVEWAVFSLLSTAGPIVESRLLRADRRRCSAATTSRTMRSSGPASTATGAWPARPTGSSPATTSCAGARSTPS